MGFKEILVIIIAAVIVAIPIVLHFIRRKKGKPSGCGFGCSSCPHSKMCDSEIDSKDNTP